MSPTPFGGSLFAHKSCGDLPGEKCPALMRGGHSSQAPGLLRGALALPHEELLTLQSTLRH